ncbi:MAG: alpha/beta hydrolase [Ardenticatenaceae bacterium]|nr:alpha/beta hydrolase [Ardenticatenaceae bacterium]
MKTLRVHVNGIELQVEDYEHSGEAVIFLHFSGANLMMWRPAVPFFQDNFRLVMLDLRGHGRSDRPETGYHIDQMARDVAELMTHLQVERAHVIGSSLGAEVGLCLAANFPERVISLVCDGALASEFGPYGLWEGSEAAFKAHAVDQLEKMRQKPEKVYSSVDAFVDSRREIFEKHIGWNEAVEAMERYAIEKIGESQYAPRFNRQAMIRYMTHYYHYRLEDYYKKVTCPILMVREDEEPENERELIAMQRLRDLAREAKIVPVDDWMHPYGWLLDPAGICRVIIKFLTQVAVS